MAIELAIMASNGKWNRVAVLEVGGGTVYSKIRQFFQAELSETDGTFKLDRINFIPEAGMEKVKAWAAVEGTFLILDCGDSLEKYRLVSHICDRTFLLSRLAPWRIERFYAFLEQNRDLSFTGILITAGKDYRKLFRKKDKEKMLLFDEVEDPFCITQKRLEELYHIAVS